ncbi:SubName: Full=Uncharacterized protein {ECO:0000313/EMBL:CCA73960.1} [Serendipita indica DSM 11827]|nr:SubName: Full=Uncharacterized protein {ECO:0000313/EMBL:CCA73960.1} [Serendipita indica DSM 11827]
MSGNFDSARTVFPSIIFILTPILGVGSLLCWTLIAHRRGTLVGQTNARGPLWRSPFRIPDEDLEDKNKVKPPFLETWISSGDEKLRSVVMGNIMPLAMQAESGEEAKPKSSKDPSTDEEDQDDEPYMMTVFISMPSEAHPRHFYHSKQRTSAKEEDWREDTSLTIGTAHVVITGPIAWTTSTIKNTKQNPSSTPAAITGNAIPNS